MAKTSGLGATIAVDNSSGTAKTISNDVTSFSFTTPRGVQDITGVDKSAMERLLLLADHSVTLNGVFIADADHAHSVFSTVPSTSVARTTTITVAAQILASEILYSDYQINRPADGSLTWTAPGALSNGTVPTWTT